MTANPNGSPATQKPGRMPNYIQVAQAYVFEQTIQDRLKEVGVAQAREDNIRLAGVQWIDNTRKALKLPVRTFDTAVVYYHKFRLVHSDGEYSFVDAAAAALFAACKIEDTLKKSRDILCAAHNLKVSRSEQLSPDDSIFEHQSRTIIGLERLMLEASGFDFRNRHPQQLMIKLAKYYGYERQSTLVKTAYGISIDLYRTFSPLKQSTPTLAFACLELAGRLLKDQNADIVEGKDYHRWGINRAMVTETLLDLLELYTHYRTSTDVGPEFPIDTFLEVRIPLNEEIDTRRLPRFTEYVENKRNQSKANTATGHGTPKQKNGPPNGTQPGRNPGNRTSPKDITSPSTNSSGGPGTGSTNATSAPAASASGSGGAIRQRMGERGREGTVRFMLNPDREREERAVIAEYATDTGA